MKALKNFGGILLAAIGVLFLLSGVGLFFDPTADFAWWEVIIILILLGLLPLFGGVALLRRKATDVRPKNCPQCGNAERAPAGVLTRSSNFWINHFGGWLFASLWGASRERQVRCVQCDTLYFIETRGTRIAGILLWVFILLILFGLLGEYFGKQ